MEAKDEKRLAELSSEATPNAFLSEMKRFLPAKRVAQLSETGLQHSVLTESGDLLRRAVLPVSSYEFRARLLDPGVGARRTYFRLRPLNELCRSRPSEVMSRHSTSAKNIASHPVPFLFFTHFLLLH